MNINNIDHKIYLKGLIEMGTVSRGWDNSQVTKKIMYCYSHNCFSDFARWARGKFKYEKAICYYEQRKLKMFS